MNIDAPSRDCTSCDETTVFSAKLRKSFINGNYSLAADLILDPISGSRCLIDDDHGVGFLATVLYGELPGELINLYLAKLMVERGVNVNYRITEADFASNTSCFEQVVDLLLEVNYNIRYNFDQIPNMIGINNQQIQSLTEARLGLIELVKVFLEFGGDPNFRSRAQGCSLFHKILKSSIPDIDVIRVFYKAGGNVNKIPRIGFPPVVSLINNSFCDKTLPMVKEIWAPIDDEICVRCGLGTTRRTTITNCALMVSMHTASTDSAQYFIDQGAQFDSVRIYNTSNAMRCSISCIFLPLLFQSLPYFKYYAAVTTNSNDTYLRDYVFRHDSYTHNEKKCQKSLICKVVSSAISPVVDAIIETTLISEKEIKILIDMFTSFNSDSVFQHFSLTYVLSALFGQSSVTLLQLCVRVIIDSTFFNKPTAVTQKIVHDLKYAECEVKTTVDSENGNFRQIVDSMDDVVIRNLLSCLHLPGRLDVLFHLEAARLQIFFNLNSFECSDEFYDVPSRSASRNSLSSDNLCVPGSSAYRLENDSELEDVGMDDDDSENVNKESSDEKSDYTEFDSSADESAKDQSSHSEKGGLGSSNSEDSKDSVSNSEDRMERTCSLDYKKLSEESSTISSYSLSEEEDFSEDSLS